MASGLRRRLKKSCIDAIFIAFRASSLIHGLAWCDAFSSLPPSPTRQLRSEPSGHLYHIEKYICNYK